MGKMKLEPVFEIILDRVKNMDTKRVLEYKAWLKANPKEYNSFDIRFACDVLHAVVSTHELCSWYNEYQVNDKHMVTLAIKVCKAAGYL